MSTKIFLASASDIRRKLLDSAGVEYTAVKPMVDENVIIASMQAEAVEPRDIADALAEHKARKISLKHPDALVIGCDQILDLHGEILQKPTDQQDARNHLAKLSGQSHNLWSAAVIYQDGGPLWRHVGGVRLQMRTLSEPYLEDYLLRNWESVRHSVGCYKLEEEGVRLFSSIKGDYFCVLGLPLVELLDHLTRTGVLNG